MAEGGEKTERATPWQRRRARERGHVAKSTEMTSALSLLAIFITMWLVMPRTGELLSRLISHTVGHAEQFTIDGQSLFVYATDWLIVSLNVLAPFFLVAIVVGLMSQLAQTGLLFSAEGIKPDLSKIDPAKGFKKIFSMRSFVELVKNMLKLAATGVVVYAILQSELWYFPRFLLTDVNSSIGYSFLVALKIGITASVILLLLAIFDYVYQVYEFEKSIMMSKQELKEEFKTMEGDPLIKQTLKERGRRIAMSRMMERAKEADVLITNPTQYAVALYFNVGMNAPLVIAKGKGFIAQKLCEVAEANDIPIVEDPPLARALFRVEIDDYIPAEHFRAVAETLAFISRANERLRAKFLAA